MYPSIRKGGVLAGFLERRKAMIVLPFTPYELIHLILTVVIIYITWKYRNTKK